MSVPADRIRNLGTAPVNGAGAYVVYWMVAYRRTRYNFALERAVERAQELKLPLLVFEPLRAGYRWANHRHHRFVVDGMIANREACEAHGVTYYPYLEPAHGEASGLLAALVEHAALIVSDDTPAFFLPRMREAIANRLDVACELVDSNGLLPLRATERVFPTAYSFRGYLQKNLKPYLVNAPKAEPLSRHGLPRLNGIPKTVSERWPATDLDTFSLSAIEIDHSVAPVTGVRGGQDAAIQLMDEFLGGILPRYGEDRNEPEKRGTSQLSPYLHFGHVSAHEVFWQLAGREEGWSVETLPDKGRGAREGWWQMRPQSESFLDELVTWREIGFNMASKWGRKYEEYGSLPDWAQKTLDEHRDDPRTHVYSLEQFESARTHDPLWNAAQRQLARDGRIHNYLRMLWGKKILEWSAQPEDALSVMVELNNKYALDGRDPNSYSGIMWVLGRYDRAWGPERPVYGKIRYMSSYNTARKVKVKNYLKRYAETPQADLF